MPMGDVEDQDMEDLHDFPDLDDLHFPGLSPPDGLTFSLDEGDIGGVDPDWEDVDNKNKEDPESSPFVTNYPRRAMLPTGCCYDDRMKLHTNADFSPGDHHPEDPARIEHIMMTLKRAGLIYRGSAVELVRILRNSPHKYMWRIPAREATREEICQVHHPSHYAWVAALSNKSTSELRKLTRIKDQGRDSLYVGSMTFEASLISAGGAIETCRAVMQGLVKNALAVIRPPGHHAEYDRAMGFCLFNNVPIAARVCQREFPDTCRKVLILDWDVHHGNGVQNMFYDDPNVLYISLHVYQNGIFYPGKPENPNVPDGGPDHCGTGPGLGRNVNIAWHDQGMGDTEYMAAFQRIVMPIAHEFDPDLVIISAGFDAADGDELGGCFVTPACYAHMTHMLMSLARGRVAACLEGGYNLAAISLSALAVARTLMGEPPPSLELGPLSKEAARVLARVQAIQAVHWDCLRPGVVNIDVVQMPHAADRLHDVVRLAQKQDLVDKYGMIALYVQRETLFTSFRNQVMATQDYRAAERLILFIHDPPALHAQPDPVDNSLDSHNAFVTDPIKHYITWAIQHKFEVVDINIPSYVTHPEDTDPFIPRADPKTIQEQTQQLVCYIWDNYIETLDSVKEVFLMGAGACYIGIKALLISRNIKRLVTGVISFVDGTLRPVRSDDDPDLATWYRNHSLVIVGKHHACWTDPGLNKKIAKRRFGTLCRSSHNGLERMMVKHLEDVQKWILERSAGATGAAAAKGRGEGQGKVE